MISKISDFALQFRAALDMYSNSIELPHFYNFPRNCCEGTSIYFAFLAMQLFPSANVEVVHAWNLDDEHHYWVDIDGLVFDLTADQFDECNAPIIGDAQSPLSQMFPIYERSFASVAICDYDAIDEDSKNLVYQTILKMLDV
ncbi:hypothetical protein L5M43_06300 [Shewanella sp. SW36]|uniref:hypothetical protein n=1 Tax=unclassified Shewanella TaxID=196818 RepID=UPI0021D97EEC|nr:MULTISPECIES: hypothetical protein [unclassified Shewanella]MCU7974890.1 hypothetical protein [Shewanella sp. SW36]MCU7990279.1 hypothetical protein [Shewanella sp. SW1]MCU8052737.1 hypothetical protein [Shewanella sp. SM43]